MESENIKNELHKYIDNADDLALNILHEAVLKYMENAKSINPIVPMTMEEYHEMIKQADEEIDKGDVFSEEEVNAYFEKKYARKL